MQNRKNEMPDTNTVGFSSLAPQLKTVLVLLGIIGAIVPVVLGCVNFDYRLDGVEASQVVGCAKDLEQDLKNSRY